MPRTFSFCNIVGDVGVKLVQDKNSWNSLIRILLKIRNRKSSTAAYHYEIQTATFSFLFQNSKWPEPNHSTSLHYYINKSIVFDIISKMKATPRRRDQNLLFDSSCQSKKLQYHGCEAPVSFVSKKKSWGQRFLMRHKH